MHYAKRPTRENSDIKANLSGVSGLSNWDNLEITKGNIMNQPQPEVAKLPNIVTTTSGLTSSTEDSLKRRCKRVVLRNRYERDSPEIRKWWLNMFKTLEDDANIPPEEQRAVLESMFDLTLLLKVLKICGSRSRKFKDELSTYSHDEITTMLASMKLRDDEGESEAKTDKRIESNVSVIDAEELQAVQVDMGMPEEGDLVEKPFVNQAVPKSRMYTNFFKRKPSRAAVWRTLPPLSMNEMNLNQKADAVTEKIATDFINWLRDLGGDEELSLSVESVIEMFEIGFHANTATSLKVNVREMPSVPKRVAEARHLPKKARRAVLRTEIGKDVKASKKKTTYTAFGRHLPCDMQVRPPAENYYRKWITCDRVPEKLASMAAVWQGITHLKSTRAFCEFLIEKPEITPPKYLYDCGMMDLKTLKEKDRDTRSDTDSLAEGFNHALE